MPARFSHLRVLLRLSEYTEGLDEKTYQHSDQLLLLLVISCCFVSSQNIYYSYKLQYILSIWFI
jgi:hypothetical protein